MFGQQTKAIQEWIDPPGLLQEREDNIRYDLFNPRVMEVGARMIQC